VNEWGPFVVGACLALLGCCILYWDWRDRFDRGLPGHDGSDRRRLRERA